MTPAEERALHAELLRAVVDVFNCGEVVTFRKGSRFETAIAELWRVVERHPWAQTPANDSAEKTDDPGTSQR